MVAVWCVGAAVLTVAVIAAAVGWQFRRMRRVLRAERAVRRLGETVQARGEDAFRAQVAAAMFAGRCEHLVLDEARRIVDAEWARLTTDSTQNQNDEGGSDV